MQAELTEAKGPDNAPYDSLSKADEAETEQGKKLTDRFDSLMQDAREHLSKPESVKGEVQVRSPSRDERRVSLSATAGGTKRPKSPQKPLETWKPAHVVPNSSRLMVGDKEELPLKGMQVDVRVDGFRARVLIDLYYFNDRPQQLEGNFQLRLPDEASPYFFAFGRTVYQAPQVTAADSMFFKPQQVSQGDTTPEKILALRGNSWEQPKVARMVPKEKAALAYRDTVRRRVDPALVEWSGAGVFQCRVFPLAPQSLHRVTIGYDVDLLRVGDDLELRLDLPGADPGHDRRSEHRRRRRPAGEPRRPRHGLGRRAAAFLPADRSQGSAACRAAAEAGHADAHRDRRGDGQLLRHPRRPRAARDSDGRSARSRPFSSSIRRSAPARSSRCGPSCSAPRWRTTATASRSLPSLSSTWRPSGGRRSSWPTRRRTSMPDELCRRPGPGRGDRSGPGTQGSGLARVAEGGQAARRARSVPAQRRRGHLGRGPLAAAGGAAHRQLLAHQGRAKARSSPIAPGWPAAIRGCWPIWPSRRAGRSFRWWARRRSPRPRWPIAIGPGG